MRIQAKTRLLAALTLNKLADLLMSAKTTLPALMTVAGAPGWMIGWLVPIRESGALLPQALVGIALRKTPVRHWVWRIGMLVQGASAGAMVLCGYWLSGWAAGGGILLALAILSLARASCSLTMKDIQADVAEKGERGKLLGLASTVSGLVTLLVSVPLVIYGQSLNDQWIALLVGCAAGTFVLAVLILWPVKTCVDTQPVQRKADSKTRFWQFDSVVYRFILVRGVFVHSALVAPYFMLEANQDPQSLLPVYLAAQALASLLSGYFWGRVADRSARLTLQLSGLLAVTSCVGLLLLPDAGIAAAGILFFVLSVAHAGVRTGRKTYSLDVREGQQRTELVAFSNTAIGLILLVFGAAYAVLQSRLDFSMVYLMTGMLVLGILLTWLLPAEK